MNLMTNVGCILIGRPTMLSPSRREHLWDARSSIDLQRSYIARYEVGAPDLGSRAGVEVVDNARLLSPHSSRRL